MKKYSLLLAAMLLVVFSAAAFASSWNSKHVSYHGMSIGLPRDARVVGEELSKRNGDSKLHMTSYKTKVHSLPFIILASDKNHSRYADLSIRDVERSSKREKQLLQDADNMDDYFGYQQSRNKEIEYTKINGYRCAYCESKVTDDDGNRYSVFHAFFIEHGTKYAVAFARKKGGDHNEQQRIIDAVGSTVDFD